MMIRPYLLLPIAAAFLSLAGACGSSAPESENLTEKPTRKAVSTGWKTGGDFSSPRKSTVGCQQGFAYLGDSPGAVDFKVRCRSRSGHERVGFSLGRAPLHGQRPAGIVDFRHHPEVLRANGTRLYGRCERSARGLSCSASSSNSVLFLGRIWVKVAEICDSEIVLSETVEQPCKAICDASSTVRIIGAGRPNGC